jgi:hypothetical protein
MYMLITSYLSDGNEKDQIMQILNTQTTTHIEALGTVTIMLLESSGAWEIHVESTHQNGMEPRAPFRGSAFTQESSRYGREALALRTYGHTLNEYGLDGTFYLHRANELDANEIWEPIPVNDNW